MSTHTWRRKWQLTPAFLPGEFHGQRNLVGYSPWGHKESAMTEHINTQHIHVHMHVLQLEASGSINFKRMLNF